MSAPVGAAAEILREIVHTRGLSAAIAALLAGVGVEPSDYEIGRHIMTLAAKYLNRVCGETLDPLDQAKVMSIAKWTLEERAGRIVRDQEEVRSFMRTIALDELLHGLELAERKTAS